MSSVKEELAECYRCCEPICRYPDGAWEHCFVDLDWDHWPDPSTEEVSSPEHQRRLRETADRYRTDGMWELQDRTGFTSAYQYVKPSSRYL